MSASDTLCCCEYENTQGERSHILACCCDCQALDEMFDRCFKCQRIPTPLVDRFIDTLIDRCRIPGILGGGASRVDLEVVTPILIIPASLSMATIGPITTVFVLLSLPYFCFFFYRTWKRRIKKSRTKFFFIWGLFSLLFMYSLFEGIMFRSGEVSVLENVIVTFGVILMCCTLRYAKKDPGVLRKLSQHASHSSQNATAARQSLIQSFGTDSTEHDRNPLLQENKCRSEQSQDSASPKTAGLENAFPLLNIGEHLDSERWCSICNMEKPARAGHCNVCGVCIDQRDHHCVWIDSCIGSQNHRSFLITMLIFVLTAYYGSYITLRTCCQLSAPDWNCDLQMVYRDYWYALCFVSACYVCLVGLIMVVGLLHQVFLISQNITSQELHRASRQGQTKCFIFAKNNAYNYGFLQNWRKFISQSRERTSCLTV